MILTQNDDVELNIIEHIEKMGQSGWIFGFNRIFFIVFESGHFWVISQNLHIIAHGFLVGFGVNFGSEQNQSV